MALDRGRWYVPKGDAPEEPAAKTVLAGLDYPMLVVTASDRGRRAG